MICSLALLTISWNSACSVFDFKLNWPALPVASGDLFGELAFKFLVSGTGESIRALTLSISETPLAIDLFFFQLNSGFHLPLGC